MKFAPSYRVAAIAAALLSSGLAMASGSSSKDLRIDMDLQQVTTTYAAVDTDDKTGAMAFELTESNLTGKTTVTYKGETQTDDLDESTGEKSDPEYDRVVISKYDDSQVLLHFTSSTILAEGSAPVTTDETITAKLVGGTWAQFANGETVTAELDSRAQARLERSFKSTLGQALAENIASEQEGAKLKSVTTNLSYGQLQLSREGVQVSAKGSISILITMPADAE